MNLNDQIDIVNLQSLEPEDFCLNPTLGKPLSFQGWLLSSDMLRIVPTSWKSISKMAIYLTVEGKYVFYISVYLDWGFKNQCALLLDNWEQVITAKTFLVSKIQKDSPVPGRAHYHSLFVDRVLRQAWKTKSKLEIQEGIA